MGPCFPIGETKEVDQVSLPSFAGGSDSDPMFWPSVSQLGSWASQLRPVAGSQVHAIGTSFEKVFNTQLCRSLQTFLGNTYFIALLKMRKKENAAEQTQGNGG